MMAATAKYRDDIAGAIATGGTSTAYTVTSYQVFDTLAHLNGQVIAFTPHTTNAGTTTLNVDGLGSKPLRTAPNVELVAGHLVQGTPYAAVYNNSDAVFYLSGFFGNPYNIPIGSSIDFWGSSAPNSSFVLAYGQAISRTTYSVLFGLFSTTYGTGDGSTTFNIPDLRGRVIAGRDDMGGSAASRLSSTYFGTSATNVGAVGGGESQTLTLPQLPSGITVSGSNTITVLGPVTGAIVGTGISGTSQTINTAAGGTSVNLANGWTFSGVNTITGTSTNTSGAAHPIVQPTIISNKLLRII